MAAGKLALLLLVGGLAGAAFAGMTTGVMAPYRTPGTAPETPAFAASPRHQSWLDEGLSLLDSPAWPFGHRPADTAARPAYDDAPGYAPDDYDSRDSYEVDRWQRAGAPDDDAPPPADEDEADLPPHQALAPQDLPPRSDAATAAADRAADAARAVIAAEHAS
jgi:hypothetical protein